MVALKTRTRKPKNWYSNRLNTSPPPILFKRSIWKKDDDNAITTFKLRSNPTRADSQQYELKARSFSTGTVEQFIQWKNDLEKIITGQNVVRATDKFAMARRVLEGNALAEFNQAASTLAVEDNESFTACLQALAEHVFPKNALSHQKAWMRRSDDVAKQPNMSTRTWAARLNEINQMLVEFPPAFNESQKISNEDFVEIIEYNIPPSWRASMVVHGFEPINHTLSEIIEFCEKLEYSEGMTRSQNAQNNNSTKCKQAYSDPNGCDDNTGLSLAAKPSQGSGKKRRERHISHAESGGTDGCALHVNATDHTTGECRVLLSQAKKMRAVWDAQPRETMSKRQKPNGSNNNYNNQSQKKNNGDFHTLLQQVEKVKSSLERALKQQQSTNGKRKNREEKSVTFEGEEEAQGNFNPDSFHLELEQLSISDDDQSPLDDQVVEENSE
jgi:hypothetical protein